MQDELDLWDLMQNTSLPYMVFPYDSDFNLGLDATKNWDLNLKTPKCSFDIVKNGETVHKLFKYLDSTRKVRDHLYAYQNETTGQDGTAGQDETSSETS